MGVLCTTCTLLGAPFACTPMCKLLRTLEHSNFGGRALHILHLGGRAASLRAHTEACARERAQQHASLVSIVSDAVVKPSVRRFQGKMCDLEPMR